MSAKKLIDLFNGMSPEDGAEALYKTEIIDIDGNLKPAYFDVVKKLAGRRTITCVVLYFGYVEHASVGCHIYRLRRWEEEEKLVLQTATQAIRLLAKDFWELYRDEYLSHLDSKYSHKKDCCKSYWKVFNFEKEKGLEPKQEALCPSCTHELTENDINLEAFREFVRGIGFADNDSFPCNDGTGGFGHWWPHASWKEILELPKGCFLEIPEKAEELITMALDPNDFEGDNAERIRKLQQEVLEFENQFRKKPLSNIDEVIEKMTKRPGYGEEIR